ncbi:MAG: N-acetylmuramic acid 6-phosphate etherase [Oscillospiraceae bacterium]|nr:N-acetylmuramic acid 6-phosphate etherase [Oscillospiraceae bacterium]
MSVNPEDIRKLTTEQRNERTMDIDLLSTVDMVRRINDENRVLADAVDEQARSIAAAVDVITARMRRGGRLIFIGAGTSGRLGVLDASECPPTFSVSPDRVVGIIAGGERALRSAVEHVEDDADAAVRQLREATACADDVVCGIAASGRTPYVIGALDYAKSVGAATLCVANNKNSILAQHSDVAIEVEVGPEALTGSTRLKSGTAQKLVLNLLTTCTMIQQGKTYSNLMVDVRATNEKLNARCLNILRAIFPEAEEAALREALTAADGSVKLAAAMLRTGKSANDAGNALNACGGSLRALFGERN